MICNTECRVFGAPVVFQLQMSTCSRVPLPTVHLNSLVRLWGLTSTGYCRRARRRLLKLLSVKFAKHRMPHIQVPYVGVRVNADSRQSKTTDKCAPHVENIYVYRVTYHGVSRISKSTDKCYLHVEKVYVLSNQRTSHHDDSHIYEPIDRCALHVVYSIK